MLLGNVSNHVLDIHTSVKDNETLRINITPERTGHNA